MGYRIILLLIVFLILVGGIFIILGQRQTNAKVDLNEAVIIKQSQQLSNSFVQDAIRELKESINNSNGVPTAYNAPNGKTTTQGNSSAKIIIHEDTYTDASGTAHDLEDNQYYIVCEVTTTAADETQYITGTNVLYQAGDSNSQEIITPGNDPPGTELTGPSYAMWLREEGIYWYLPHNNSGNNMIHQWFQSGQTPDPTNPGSVELDSGTQEHHIIYFPNNLVPSNVLYLSNYHNGSSGDNAVPITLNYSITIIVAGDIRIDGSLKAYSPHKINVIALPYGTNNTPGRIITSPNGGKWPSSNVIIDANLYARNVSNITLGSQYNQTIPRKYPHNWNTLEDVLNDPDLDLSVPDGGGTDPDPDPINPATLEKKLVSWEEKPVQIIRP